MEDNVPQTHTVEIKGVKFQPNSLSIGVGDTVQWINRDAIVHTVTEDNGKFDSGSLGKDDPPFSQTFSSAGTTHYHCEIHPGMKGTVTVT